MSKIIYLDYAAATPMNPSVRTAMVPYFSQRYFNPSATYQAARAVANDIAAARGRIAHWLGSRPNEIIFAAGGTEANNLAIQGVMRAHSEGSALVSAIEHESVLRPADQFKHKIIKVLPDGQIDTSDLQKKIDHTTVLVSVMYANNEIGTIQSIRDIARIIQKKRDERQKSGINLPLYFHTDACQAAAYLDLHVHRLGVDLMTINGGKIYGPKQSGVLFVKAGTKLRPQMLGGGQERGLRSGTENVAAIIGLAKALDLVQTRRKQESDRLRRLQQLFFRRLQEQFTHSVINGSLTRRLPNNVHVTIPGQDNERLVMQLDELGILCAAGSACSAASQEPSHVLRAIGLSDQAAQASLRFSMGSATTARDIAKTINLLAQCI